MNVFSRRAVRRVGIGAVALAVSAAVAGIASPAYAATPADLAVTVESSKIAAGSSGKDFVAKVRNIGETETVGLTLAFNTSGLDATKVTASVVPGTEAVCAPEAGAIKCTLADALISPNGNVEMPIHLTPVAGQTGDAGALVVKVASAGAAADPDGNNTATVDPITIVGSGADLIVVAFDVYELDDGGVPVGPVKPGDEAELPIFVANFGDKAATEWKITTVLPEHVSFVEVNEDLCTYSADKRTEACTLSGEEWLMLPGWGFDLANDVKVAATAPGPVNLTGGTVTVELITEVEAPPTVTKAAPSANRVNADDKVFDKVDSGDNSDAYTVFVGPKPAGGGGTLPITGAKAGLIGGAGAAALVVGALLFVMARRRRVLLTTLTD